MDPRWWLTPFLYIIYGLDRSINVAGALKELQQLELADENEGIVYPTTAGFNLIDELTCRRGIVGFHSYYFEDGKPVQSTQVLLGTLNTNWLIICGENSVLSSLNAKAAQKIIEQALTPGEAVPKGYGIESPMQSAENGKPFVESATAQGQGTDTWTCSCGKVNKGKFCFSCGKAKGATVQSGKKLFCRNCGSERKPDAKFCLKCGQRL